MKKEELQNLRIEYSQHILDEASVHSNPFIQFSAWLKQAVESELPEPNAFSLATCGLDGFAKNRIVLLKEITPNGLVFFTNYESDKAREIEKNPNVSVCFLWLELERQVRIEGTAHRISQDESEAYFATRPRASQLGAWASKQSEEVLGRNVLETRFAEAEVRFEGKDIPMPAYWGGFCIKPVLFEFWQGRQSRLHDRIRYKKSGQIWSIARLSP